MSVQIKPKQMTEIQVNTENHKISSKVNKNKFNAKGKENQRANSNQNKL